MHAPNPLFELCTIGSVRVVSCSTVAVNSVRAIPTVLSQQRCVARTQLGAINCTAASSAPFLSVSSYFTITCNIVIMSLRKRIPSSNAVAASLPSMDTLLNDASTAMFGQPVDSEQAEDEGDEHDTHEWNSEVETPSSQADEVLPVHSLLLTPRTIRPATLTQYITACTYYGVTPNPGLCIALHYQLEKIRPARQPVFRDLDMLALGDLFLYGHTMQQQQRQSKNNASTSQSTATLLSHVKHLDFSLCQCTAHSAAILAHTLHGVPSVETLNLTSNRLGRYGATILQNLFLREQHQCHITTLLMRSCAIGEKGAYAIANILAHVPLNSNTPEDALKQQNGEMNKTKQAVAGASNKTGPDVATASTIRPLHRLCYIDLSNNQMGIHGVRAIESACRKRAELGFDPVTIDLEANLVFAEVMNSVTHGVGVLLCFIGAYLMYQQVQHKSATHFYSTMMYILSLCVLYCSSTLYHSFFVYKRTK